MAIEELPFARSKARAYLTKTARWFTLARRLQQCRLSWREGKCGNARAPS